MGRFVVVFLAALGLAPASAQAPVSDGPDGLLVMGVVGNETSPSAVHGERAVVADPRTGYSHARRLPGGTLCHGPLLAVGDAVLYSGYRGRRATTMSLPLTLAGVPHSLGAADTTTPSGTPGRLWLGRWRHGRGVSRVGLREVDLGTGTVVSRTSELLPRWSRLEAALDGGFVVGHGRWLTFWEHALDRPLRSIRDGWLLAAGRSRFAWCGARCRDIRIWSRHGERVLEPPDGLRLQAGARAAFSPGGEQLALPVIDGDGQRLAVVDLASGDWTLVPGGRLGVYGAIAWSPLGAWVYFTGGAEDVLAWAPGMARATRVPVDPGGTVMSIATTG